MSTKNSQILLIENALSSLNKHIYEKDNSIRVLENQAEKFKETISNLKYEYKTAINEQGKLEDTVEKLEKHTISLKNQIKEKNDHLAAKVKELDSMAIHNEDFLQKIETRMAEYKKQLEEKNSIILEFQKINSDINKEMQHLKEEYDNSGYDNSMLKKELKNQRKTITKLEKKLKQEEFRNFIDSKNKFDYSVEENDQVSDDDFTSSLRESAMNHSELRLEKLEGKLLAAKKTQNLASNKAVDKIATEITEEDIIRKRLGF